MAQPVQGLAQVQSPVRRGLVWPQHFRQRFTTVWAVGLQRQESQQGAPFIGDNPGQRLPAGGNLEASEQFNNQAFHTTPAERTQENEAYMETGGVDIDCVDIKEVAVFCLNSL